MPLTIQSPAFPEGGAIPRPYTCDGKNVSPPLSWTGLPAGVKSLALVCDDPDAPARVWVHWVIYNLPPAATGLPEGVPPRENVAGGGLQGTNDFRKVGYGGPCPPSGTHRYRFTLYALGEAVLLAAGATKADLVAAMKGLIRAESTLTGKYSRH